MYFIYSLSYKKKVFYIGRSRRPVGRLSEHICGNCIYINGKPKHGVYPKFKILSHHEVKSDACKAEYKTIQQFKLAGMPLLNQKGFEYLINIPAYTGRTITLGRDDKFYCIRDRWRIATRGIFKYMKNNFIPGPHH